MLITGMWGIVTGIIILLTNKYYIPVLLNKNSSDISENDEKFKRDLTKTKKWLLLIFSAAYACICGYAAQKYAVSPIAVIKMSITMFVLACVFMTDLQLHCIPNKCCAFLIVSRLIIMVVEYTLYGKEVIGVLGNNTIAFLLGTAFLLFLRKISKGGIGYGDIKILSCIGFMCGIRALSSTIFFSFILSGLIGIFLMISKTKSKDDFIPMGPFIWMGFGASLITSLV